MGMTMERRRDACNRAAAALLRANVPFALLFTKEATV